MPTEPLRRLPNREGPSQGQIASTPERHNSFPRAGTRAKRLSGRATSGFRHWVLRYCLVGCVAGLLLYAAPQIHKLYLIVIPCDRALMPDIKPQVFPVPFDRPDTASSNTSKYFGRQRLRRHDSPANFGPTANMQPSATASMHSNL